MKPQTKLAETQIPSGSTLALFEHDGTYAIRINGQGLMDSKASASEITLGEIGTSQLLSMANARVLIGGLGLGFTLKSVLERVPASAEVHVAELIPAVVQWNHEFLYSLNGKLLNDPRVSIHSGDVVATLATASRDPFDAILLDIDNGPSAMVHGDNNRLYDATGLRNLFDALRPAGRAVIWSASEDPAFEKRLRRTGFTVETVRAKRYATARRAAITLYVADKASSLKK